MDKPIIYIVTYWDDNKEPVVTAFDNKEAAESYYNYSINKHKGCCLDETKIYSSFIEIHGNELHLHFE